MTARLPKEISDAVKSVNPQGNPSLQPGQIDGKPVLGITWCNLFAKLVSTLLNCPIPFILADLQIKWLSGEQPYEGTTGPQQGWREETNPQQAQAWANAGKVVFVTYYNIHGHGHIALVIPAQWSGQVCIAQAGSVNFNQGYLRHGFGGFPVRYWVHD